MTDLAEYFRRVAILYQTMATTLDKIREMENFRLSPNFEIERAPSRNKTSKES